MPFRPSTSLLVQKGFDKRKEEELSKAFRDADRDKDGFLSMEEYIKVFKAHGVNITREEVIIYFANKDRDRDGKISFAEFCGKKTKTEKAFQALDINDDGYISKPEMMTASYRGGRRLSMKEVDSAFQLYDEDKDNKLNYPEFCALMNRRKSTDSLAARSRSNSEASRTSKDMERLRRKK